jgi:ammonia channel protein AmtB
MGKFRSFRSMMLIRRQVWNPAGWAFKWGVLDYAGGGPIEVCSGVTGLAYSVWLGKRTGWGTSRLSFRPHNVSHVVIGTVFLWFGWLGKFPFVQRHALNLLVRG